MSEPPVEYIELNLNNYDEYDVSQLNEWGSWAISEIERLETINTELLAACGVAVHCIHVECQSQRTTIEAAIAKAKGGEQ